MAGWSRMPSESRDNAVTFYVGRISSVNAWHDLVKDPADAEFVDAFVAVAALSQVFGRYHDDHLSSKWKGRSATTSETRATGRQHRRWTALA